MPYKTWPEFTPEFWEPYLKALEETGMYIAAADAVGVSVRSVRDERNTNPAFQVLCDEAIERYKASFVTAAADRARKGVKRPIIGGRNRDTVVAEETVYADGLMSMFLKRHDPSFRDKTEVNVTGDIDVRREMNVASMSKRARQKLRELLEILQEEAEAQQMGPASGEGETH